MADFPSIQRPTEHDWSAWRRQMPVTAQWVYLDHAAVAPLPSVAATAIQDWLDGATQAGDTVWPVWMRGVARTRQLAAQFIGATEEEIALVPNTTTGISLVAEGFPWVPGDNVVTLADEFPSNQYPWLHLADRGVQTRRVPVAASGVDLDRVAAAIDERTRIVTVSWVGFASGWRMDLDAVARLAHSRGAMLFVDAIQGLGVFPLDVRQTPIDFLAADGHKWLLGPEGAGVLYVRRAHLDRLRPLMVGWNSVAQGSDYSRIELRFRDSAARYEGGSHNVIGMLALGASLQLLAAFGLQPGHSPIAERVLKITDLACQQLSDAGAVVASARTPQHSSGIVSFDWPGEDPVAVRRRCLERHVVLSCRGGHLRISPHAYNNEEDLERLVEALRR